MDSIKKYMDISTVYTLFEAPLTAQEIERLKELYARYKDDPARASALATIARRLKTAGVDVTTATDTQPAGNNPDEADPAPEVKQTGTPDMPNSEPEVTQTGTPDMPDSAAADTQPAGNNPDEADPAAPATDTQPAGNNPDEADPAAPATPAAQPGQQTSGLPAKLGQVKSSNLMKDYNAGGRKPMAQVKDVQTALSRLGFDPNGLDGKYGPGTFKAVQEFQKANGLTVDGQVGPNTIKALQAALGGNAAPEVKQTGTPDMPNSEPEVTQTGTPDMPNSEPEVTQTGTPDMPNSAATTGTPDMPNGGAAEQVTKDTARAEELLAKLAAEQQNASTDFSHLIAIVEGRALKEALSAAEVKELQDIVARHKDNPKFDKALLSRAQAAVASSSTSAANASGNPTPANANAIGSPEKKLKDLEKVSAADNKVAPVSTAPTTGSGNPTPANADAGKPAQPDFAKQARDQEALNKKVQADQDAKALGDFGGKQDPTAMKDIKAPTQAAPEPEKNVVRDGSGKVVKSGDGTPVRTRSDNQIWWDQNMQGKPFPGDTAAQKEIDKRKAQGDKNWNSIKNFFSGNRKTTQNASKDFSMKTAINESTNLDECGGMSTMPQQQGSPVSMNVTLNASGEQHVQDLIRMMQLAGASAAAPVSDKHINRSDSHDDMLHMMTLASEEQEDTAEYDAVIDEWDNSPEEEYKDHNYMTQDLSGGINRPKKAYAKAQDGDNAMAVEAIKSDLRKALEEALKGK